MRLIRIAMCMIVLGACLTGNRTRAEEVIDEIVAVVDEAIILKSDVMQQMAFAALQQGLTREQLAGAQAERMFRTILETMIQDELMIAKAKEDSLEVPSEMVEQRVRDHMQAMKEERGAAAFREQLEAEDLTEREVRDRLRLRFRKDAIRQMMQARLMQQVTLSPREVGDYKTRHADGLPPIYSISHIMVSPQAGADLEAEAKKEAEALLDRINSGEDFGELAREFSEDPGSAARGGDLGFFSRGDMVSSVEEAAFTLSPGEVSGIVPSEFGFHILKVEEKQGTRVRARHILIALQPSETDLAKAYQKAVKLLERIEGGETFAEVARQESDHAESAPNGGKLGNYTAEQPPPGFADALRTMSLGDVSRPIQTEFGWHLVKVNDDESTLEEIVRQMKIQDYFERVLAETREKLYIDVRI